MQTFFKIAFLIATLCSINACQTYKVHPITASTNYNEIKNNGIIYYLPKTELCITLEVTKTTYTKGIYSHYSHKLLNIDNPIDSSYSFYNISNIQISPKTLPDSNAMFFIELPSRYKKKNQPLILSLNKYGLLLQRNNLLNEENNTIRYRNDSIPFEKQEKLYNEQMLTSNLYEKTDTIIEKMYFDSTFVEKKIYKTKTVAKSEGQKATEAASIIIDLRDACTKLLIGDAEVPYDAKTIQYMYEQIKLLEKNYLELFTGTVTKKKLHYKYNINPVNSKYLYPICSFDKVFGINKIDAYHNIMLSFKPYSKSVINNSLLTKRKNNNILYCKVPNCFKMEITLNEQVLYEQNIYIAQFSDITALPIIGNIIKLNETDGTVQKIQIK